MFYLACTRFDDKTWIENINYKEKEKMKGVIYGVSIKINEKYPLNSILFVVEMNNAINEIYGISLIRNSMLLDKKYHIYENTDYNRYIYRGDYWISRDNILLEDRMIVDILEKMLFKGKSHVKRITGISVITNKLFSRWEQNEEKVKETIKKIFIKKFKSTF